MSSELSGSNKLENDSTPDVRKRTAEDKKLEEEEKHEKSITGTAKRNKVVVEPLIHGSRDQTFQQLFAEELKKKKEEHQAEMKAAMKKKENEFEAAMKKKEEEFEAEREMWNREREMWNKEREMWNKKEQELNESLANAQKELADDRETIDKLSLKTLVTNGVPPPKACGSALVHFPRNRHAKVVEDNRHVDLSNFEPTTMTKYKRFVGSALLSLLEGRIDVSFCSENDIQFYVKALLLDAAKCLGIDVDVFGEMSLFSLRPDLVVVKVRNTGSIILVVEVKNPPIDTGDRSQTGNEAFESSMSLAGQVYDYLKAMVQSGHEMPFVLLTNYQEMYIARLKHKKQEYDGLMDEAQSILSSDIEKFSKLLNAGFQGSKETASPNKDFNIADDTTDETCAATRTDDVQTTNKPAAVKPTNMIQRLRSFVLKSESEKKEHEILRSKIFKRTDADFFKSFVYAIACGVLSCRNIDRTKNDLPRENELASKRGELAYVSKTAFEWKTLNAKFRFCWDPPKGRCPYYLVQVLGIGRNGKVFLAASRNGELFALKLFLPRLKFAADDKEKKTQWAEAKKKSKMEADFECKLWKDLYEITSCQVEEVNNTWSLTMPFVQPLPAARRMEVLDKVEEKLLVLAKKGYVYRDEDVRWRHVGCRNPHAQDLDILLIDLGSLKKHNDAATVTVKSLVKKQKQSLLDRARVGDPAPPDADAQAYATL